MQNLHRILVTILAILIFPALNSQDITGDWHGKLQRLDSLSVSIHIYKDDGRLKAMVDMPDEGVFGKPIAEITYKNDTLFFRIPVFSNTYKGHVNREYSKIDGNWNQSGNKYGLDFGRDRLVRTLEVDERSFRTQPAKVRVVKSGNPQTIPYTGTRVVEAGIPEIIEIDTSKLEVFTPGKNSIPNPEIIKFSNPVTRDEYLLHPGPPWKVPVLVRAKHTEPVQVQPMRIKEAARFNIQYLHQEQGLVDPSILCMLEDAKGNLWFGSGMGGICRYDGKSLTYFNRDEGLSATYNRFIREDRSGNIWIGSSSGFCKYDGKYFTQYSGRVFSGVFSFLETEYGEIWLGTTRSGAFVKKGNSWTRYTEKQGLIKGRIFSIGEDKNGNIWFGSEAGVCKFDGKSFTHFTENEGLGPNAGPMMEDRSGNLWFRTSGQGVYKYDGTSFHRYTVEEGLSSNDVISIMEDSRGCMWFGTFGGVNVYDGKSFTHYTTRDGLNNYQVGAVIEDKSGNIWLTTGGGVLKLQRNSFNYFTELEEMGTGKVRSIIEDHSGNIWFGTDGEGLIKHDGDSFTVMKRSEGGDIPSVLTMLEDEDGYIWFTSFGGLNLHKYYGRFFTIYENNEIRNSAHGQSILKCSEGNIWVGTWGEGILNFDGESFTEFPGIRNPKFIKSILQDRKGNIWFGGLGSGLIKYDGKYITKYNLYEGLSDNTVLSLFEDINGNLWIGTRKGGINKFDGQKFTHFTEKEGLSNNCVNSVIGDKKGNIWVGTNRGLSLLSPRGNGSYSIISFDHEDGLKKLSFNDNAVCLDSRNRLWWGTEDIITMLDLNQFEIIPEPPVVQLNTININQEYIDYSTLSSVTVELDDSPFDTARIKIRGLNFSDVVPFYNYPLDLELTHNLNHLTFNFSAIDWTAPQSIRYRYMLEGMDEKWSPLTKENLADYRNIPPGEYKFKVKAISKTHVWSETLEYPFSIRRPWWFRWWAYTFYAMVLILLARYYIRYIISRERIKAEVQIKQVEVDKMQELDQMKSRFFVNVSHEFRTPLTLLLGPVEELIKNLPSLSTKNRSLLQTMKKNAHRLQNLINQLLDISKLETGKVRMQVSEGNLTEFIRAIVLSFLSLAERKNIRYEYDLPEIPGLVFFDKDKLEKILTNLISNAFKFTDPGGIIKVILKYSLPPTDSVPEYIDVTVSDSGRGIPEDKLEKVFDRFYQVNDSSGSVIEGTGIGLALTKELVELYRGEIKVKSMEGEGTTFTLKIPVARSLFREDERKFPSEESPEPVAGEPYQQSEIKPDIPEDKVKEKDKPVVLIVEDNPDLTQYISGNLEKQYRIVSAGDGKQGFELAVEHIPDLVISDLMMPVMDGMEMCGLIKEDERTSHIPVIMLTARADRDSKLEGLQTGVDDYIIKPFDAEELQIRVKNMIHQRQKLREKFRKELITEPEGSTIISSEDMLLNKVLEICNKHLADSDFNIDRMSGSLNMSRTQLYRKVHSITGYAPMELLQTIRLKQAALLLESGEYNISQVAYQVGFNNMSYFAKCYKRLYKVNPSEHLQSRK